MAQPVPMLRQSVGMSGTSVRMPMDHGPLRIQQSVGQASVIGHHRVAGTALRQGFLQPLGSLSFSKRMPALDMMVFPNPFTKGFHLRPKELAFEGADIELFDGAGRLALQQHGRSGTGLYIPAGTLRTGSYLLRVRAGGRFFTTTLQKQ